MLRSSTTTEGRDAESVRLDPVTPGELLKEEFLEPLAFPNTALQKRRVFPRNASARSCWDAAPLRPTRICAYAASLA